MSCAVVLMHSAALWADGTGESILSIRDYGTKIYVVEISSNMVSNSKISHINKKYSHI